MYKRSYSCGMTIYSVENKTVTIYHIDTGHCFKYTFNTVSDAIAYYETVAIPDEILGE